MTRTLSMVQAFALAAALTAPAAAGAAHMAETSDQVLDARGLRRLAVDNHRGRVEVSDSPDGRIHLRAIKVCRADSDARAREYAAQTSVSSQRDGDSHRVHVTYPRKISVQVSWWDILRRDGDLDNGLLPRVEVLLQVRVPRGLAVEVQTASGDVESATTAQLSIRTSSGDVSIRGGSPSIRTTSGDVVLRAVRRATVRSTSGDVTADSVRGGLDIASTSGDLRLGWIGDTLAVVTTSGDISVARAARGANIETTSGEVQAFGISGGLRVHTLSGGVEVTAARDAGTVNVETTSGAVRLATAPALGARLDLESRSGSIDCEVPVAALETGRRSLKGTIGGGGAPIRITTVSGDITVTRGGR